MRPARNYKMQKQSPMKNIKKIAGLLFQKGQLSKLQPSVSVELIEKCMQNPITNRGLGCMFGAFIGDALGSYCEFKQKISPQLLQKTMEMPGKGTFNVMPGQFTDDSQLASHLLQALSDNKSYKGLNQQLQTQLLLSIASSYRDWYRSGPFDIGNTTRCAFSVIKTFLFELKCAEEENDKIDYEVFLQDMLKKIAVQNRGSESNGSLMRITPMPFFLSLFGSHKNFALENKSFIQNQVNMTHGSGLMRQVGFAWVELLHELITRSESKKKLKEILKEFIAKYEIDEDIHPWVEESLKEDYMKGNVNMGWAKIAFSYGIKKLRELSEILEQQFNEQVYVKQIADVIGRAGDTDTNGAIVGGLIGASLGFSNLPTKYLEKQFELRLDSSNKCEQRGSQYEPRLQLIRALQMVETSKILEGKEK